MLTLPETSSVLSCPWTSETEGHTLFRNFEHQRTSGCHFPYYILFSSLFSLLFPRLLRLNVAPLCEIARLENPENRFCHLLDFWLFSISIDRKFSFCTLVRKKNSLKNMVSVKKSVYFEMRSDAQIKSIVKFYGIVNRALRKFKCEEKIVSNVIESSKEC